MTRICVAVLDEDTWTSRTDIIVVADTTRRRLTWIPRDLWSPLTRDRINMAFARDPKLLLDGLAEFGFRCSGLLCLRRGATISALAEIEVDIPVGEPLDFHYPLAPLQPIEQGSKLVSFRPPSERLSGERLHQWIGARYEVGRAGSDLNRLRRQVVFIRALLENRSDFSRVLADPDRHRTFGKDPVPHLARVNASWTMRVHEAVRSATIDGKQVLVPLEKRTRFRRWLLKLRRRLEAVLFRHTFGRRHP